VSAKKKTAAAVKKTTAVAKRKDFGAPVDGFFAKQTGAIKALADPLREGEGKTGRHLKLLLGASLPKKDIEGWLEIAAKR
jgi:hypothetical protein